MPNELALIFRWSTLIGGNPVHGNNELAMLRQIARARGHETTSAMNEVAALRAIAVSYGKDVTGLNEMLALRAIVDGMGATPSNRNLHDMNEIDCLWAIIRAGGGAAGYDADAADYFARVVTASGTLSDATKTAVNAFVVAAKANGYWTKLTRINLFCGDQLAAALVPLKVGGGSATDTNTNFVGGDYSEATGLTAGTGNEFLNTGLLANALTDNDTHLAVYNRTNGATGGGAGIGTSSGAANQLALLSPFSDGTVYSDHYNITDGRLTFAITGVSGFLVGSRISAADHKIYRNGSGVAASGTVGGGLLAQDLYVFALNLSGAASNFVTHNFAAYSIGSGLTAGNVTSYNTDLEAFQDALGRGVQ